jgi:hypothetical protein
LKQHLSFSAIVFLSTFGGIMKRALLLVLAASLLLLQACGGGGGDTTTNTPGGNGGGTNTNPGGDTGANSGSNTSGSGDQGGVVAPFVSSGASVAMLIYPEDQKFSIVSPSQQADDGAMTMISGNTLSGNYAIQDIAGNASFAIGRWVKGDVTLNSGTTDTLTGADGRAYHYIAYEELSSFPTKSLLCTARNYTMPTYTNGGRGAALTGTLATTTGATTIVFNNSLSGTLNGSITVNANGETINIPFPINLVPRLMTTNSLSSSGTKIGVELADAGDGAYALAVQYTAVMPSGARYIGVVRLYCW